MVPLDFGNPAIPVGPVAFRPPIARSLALSVSNEGPFRQSQPIKDPPISRLFSALVAENFRTICGCHSELGVKNGHDLYFLILWATFAPHFVI
jgi:hypothetical protein